MKFNSNLLILFFTLVVVMMGFGMVIPIIPFYIESFGAGGSAMGLFMAIFSIMQFAFAPLWGSLSDRFGRKKIIIIGALGNGISLLLLGLSTRLWMLFASRALAGILSSATFPAAMAFIGDSTTEENRSGGMGIIGAAMGIGMVIGPGIGGLFAENNLSMPFYIGSGLSIIAFFLILLILPETLPPEARSSGRSEFKGPQIRSMWNALHGPIGFLFFMGFLVSFALTAFEGIFGLYALHRFQYGPSRVGTILTVIGLTSAIAQGLLTGPLAKRFGEQMIIKVSLLGSIIGFILMLLAGNFVTVLITVGFFVISNAMLRPSISSSISQLTDEDQGITMGLNNSFMSLGRFVGPLLAGILFDINIILPYLSASFILLIGLIMSLKIMKPVKKLTSPKTVAEL